MFQLFMLLAARWYASNYLVLDMSVASVVVRSLNKCPQNWLSTRKISFYDTFMIFIIITINNVMIIITLCPEATSSCNRCFFNVRCPCQPPYRHRHQWDTAPSPSPGHVARAWPGDTCLGHVACAGRAGGDWTGLGSTLFCCVPRWFICCCPAPVWVARSLRRLRPAGRANIKHMAGTSLHPFITRLRIRWTSVHQPRHLDVAVASPCLFIFIQLAWTHNTAACHRHHQPGGQKVD